MKARHTSRNIRHIFRYIQSCQLHFTLQRGREERERKKEERGGGRKERKSEGEKGSEVGEKREERDEGAT